MGTKFYEMKQSQKSELGTPEIGIPFFLGMKYQPEKVQLGWASEFVLCVLLSSLFLNWGYC